MIRLVGMVMACLLSTGVSAEPEDPRITAEIEATLLRLSDMGALDDVQPQSSLTIEREARVRFELGAVIGLQPGVEEPPIVAITPGGHAERMGLKVGDLIIMLNGLRLAESENPGQDFARLVNQAQGRVDLQLRRDGRLMQVEGNAEAILVPGFSLTIRRPVTFAQLPEGEHAP